MLQPFCIDGMCCVVFGFIRYLLELKQDHKAEYISKVTGMANRLGFIVSGVHVCVCACVCECVCACMCVCVCVCVCVYLAVNGSCLPADNSAARRRHCNVDFHQTAIATTTLIHRHTHTHTHTLIQILCSTSSSGIYSEIIIPCT